LLAVSTSSSPIADWIRPPFHSTTISCTDTTETQSPAALGHIAGHLKQRRRRNKKKEKKGFAEEIDLKNKGTRADLKRKEKLKLTVLRLFLLLRMTGILTAGGEVKRGGNQTKSLVFLDFLRWCVSPRAASGGARGADVPPLSCSSRSLPDTVLNCFGLFCKFQII
jgi:hypothetical protein